MNDIPRMLQTVEISRSFDERLVLDRVSMNIDPGDRLALVGPSGSGKSLLLRTIAMLEQCHAGEVRWHGEAVTAANATAYRSQVVYVRQTPARFSGTVEQHLRRPFQLAIHRGRAFDRTHAVEQLERVGRPESFLNQPHDELSGGEAQLVALICAIQLDPAVLLLDEPTSALDETTAVQAETLIGNWFAQAPERKATVWVTHSRTQAQRICDRVLQIADGSLVRSAPSSHDTENIDSETDVKWVGRDG